MKTTPQTIVFQEADREIPEQPRARSGMFRQLWVALGLPAMLKTIAQEKERRALGLDLRKTTDYLRAAGAGRTRANERGGRGPVSDHVGCGP